MSVIADTRYPDGKDGQVHGGIDVHGRTDADGQYEFTWTVDPTTPTGAADIQVAAVDGSGTGNKRLPFTVARSCS
jgi:hypothetical protein